MRVFLICISAICFITAASGASGASGAMAASTITIVTDSPPITMDPSGSYTDSNMGFMANIFDGLTERKGENGELKPALAVKWERKDDLSWKFWLRKGVKFHNGNDFTATDVKFSFERLKKPEVSKFTDFGNQIASIDIIDDYTLEIKTTSSLHWFVQQLHMLFIVDKESSEKRNQGDMGQKPIGTGAYKFKEWIKGSYLKLTVNNEYWAGKPSIDDITFRAITETATRFAALVSGKADIMGGVPVAMYDRVASNSKLKIVSRPARRAIFLMLGNKPGTPLADAQVRKAIAMAINEDEIITKIMRGQAFKASQVPDSMTIGYNPDIRRIEYNPSEAKKLLKQAGYANGFDMTLSGPNNRYVQDSKIAEAVVKYLAKIGINAKLDVKPMSIYGPELTTGKLQCGLLGWFDSTNDLSRTYGILFHSFNKEAGFGSHNGVRYKDKQIDEMIKKANQITDTKKREQHLQELNRISIEDKVLYIPLHYQSHLYAIKKDKKIRFDPRPDKWMVAKEISLE
ncbi:MAG: ABC transporter substrate-binding protein [Desulfobacteraceae bacterium]|nr:ABC transporter substrate-binding protein [Desulfobacteraceae bacterium]